VVFVPAPALLRTLKLAIFLLALIPIGLITWGGFHNSLGANPVEAITHRTGDWTLRFLILTLSVTPARRITGLHWLIRFRRMLGLFAFFYATLHFTTYLWLDQDFLWHEIVKDVAKRPYITVGFSALLMMIPLVLTSTRGMVKRLGGARWQKLHRLVYVIATFGVLHYLWLVKSDIREPVMYGCILLLLFSYRAWYARFRDPRAKGVSAIHRAAALD
jgi:sulfoxide reductase heme-binding subunit YedZ